MDGFSFTHHASPAHHHHQHHHQQQHQQQAAHHHQQPHQHPHTGHHDAAAAAAALSTGAAAHTHAHQHAHQTHHNAATSTPTGTHHAYGVGQSTYEDLIAARTQLTDAVNRLSQAYRASYEASDLFGRVCQRASNSALAQFFGTNNASPFMSGDFNMFFSGLDTHTTGSSLGALQSGMVGTGPQPGATLQTSYASLAQGNNNAAAAQQAAQAAASVSGSALGGATGAAPNPAAPSSGGAGASGEKKGRRSRKDKKERDPNAPKRPPSAYILFQNDVRDSTRREVPELSYAGVLAKISTMWKALSDEERNAYTERRKKAMAEYSILKKQYHARVAAAGGVVKDESDSDDEEEEEAQGSQSINPAATLGTNGTPNRLLGGALGGNGLTSPSSVDPAQLKKRKPTASKDLNAGKRPKH